MFAGKTTALLQLVAEHEVRREASLRLRAGGSADRARCAAAPPQRAGRRVVVVKSDKDRRFSDFEVVSHDGLRRVRGFTCRRHRRMRFCSGSRCARAAQPCYALPQLMELHKRLSPDEFNSFDVIAVDEVRSAMQKCTLCRRPASRNRPLPLFRPQAQFFADLKEFCTQAADTHGKTVLVAGLDGDFRRDSFGKARRRCAAERVRSAIAVAPALRRCCRRQPAEARVPLLADSGARAARRFSHQEGRAVPAV